MKLPKFHWVTLTTGLRELMSLAPMKPAELAQWQPVLASGGQLPGMPDYELTVTHALGGVLLSLSVEVMPGLSVPVVSWVAALEPAVAATLWSQTEALYREQYEGVLSVFTGRDVKPGSVTQPTGLPWGAETYLAGIGLSVSAQRSAPLRYVREKVITAFYQIYLQQAQAGKP